MSLDGGLAKVSMTHDGSSNFIVWLTKANGELVDLLANKIGPYSGSRATPVGSRDYYFDFDVEADGAWTIEVKKPWRWPRALTARYTGTGDRAPRVFRTAGGFLKFRYAHTGESNFIIWLYKTNGRRVDLIANRIGTSSGSTGVTVPKGKYVLDIQSEGDWSVRIRKIG